MYVLQLSAVRLTGNPCRWSSFSGSKCMFRKCPLSEMGYWWTWHIAYTLLGFGDVRVFPSWMPSQWADLTSSWSPFSSNATIVCGTHARSFLVALSLMIDAQVLCLVVSGGVSNNHYLIGIALLTPWLPTYQGTRICGTSFFALYFSYLP